MKTTLCFLILAAASLSFSGCADNEPRHNTVVVRERHRPVERQVVIETRRDSRY